MFDLLPSKKSWAGCRSLPFLLAAQFILQSFKFHPQSPENTVLDLPDCLGLHSQLAGDVSRGLPVDCSAIEGFACLVFELLPQGIHQPSEQESSIVLIVGNA